MDFLTTNFHADATVQFTAAFRLLDLPLEILFKVMVFLDEPELRALALTCHYLRSVCSERFIMRSKFFYVRDKIGIRLSELRPALSELYEQHILPVQNAAMLANTAHIAIINDLQRSFRRNSLSKSLQKRPDISELHQKNIIPPDSTKSPLIKSRVKDFKRENLSQMLQVLLKSYRFQKKITSSDVADAALKINSTGLPPFSPSMTKTEHISLLSKIELIEKRARSQVTGDQYVDVSEEFVRIYNKLCSRLGHTLIQPKTRSVSTPIYPFTSPDTPQPPRPTEAHVLNHVEQDIPRSRRSLSAGNEPMTPTRRGATPGSPNGPKSQVSSTASSHPFTISPESPIEEIDTQGEKNYTFSPIPTVRSRKQYFEQLSKDSSQTTESPASLRTPSENFLRPVSRISSASSGRNSEVHAPCPKPTRTVLKASVINDSIISYEKLF